MMPSWLQEKERSVAERFQDVRIAAAASPFVGTSTERTQSLAAARLAAIVESSEDAILSNDLDGVITSWNQGAERIFGYAAEEAIGRPVTMLMPSDRYEEEEAILGRIRRGERVQHYETVRRRKDGALFDVSLTVSPIKEAGGRIVGASKIVRDITERRRLYERQALLLVEMNHRAKNLFALMSSLVTLSAQMAKSIEDMDEALRGRIRALAAAHDLTLPDLAKGATEQSTSLDALARAILAPYAQVESGSEPGIWIEGEPAPIGGVAVTNLALLLHELATNAAKYGALSSPTGRLSVTWSRAGEEIFLTWREANGPPIAHPPSATGFGTFVARRAIEDQLGGRIERDWGSEGLTVRLSLPLARLTGK